MDYINKQTFPQFYLANRILLGLVMLVPGILKLFVTGHSAIENMLAGMGFPIAGIFAWVLIFSEIIFGLLVLVNWQIKWTVIPPIIIFLVAAFTASWGSWSSVLMHLVIVSNYLLIAYGVKTKGSCCFVLKQ